MERRHLLTMAAGSFVLRGQEFEAASIKPSAPAPIGQFRVGIQMLPGGRISMTGVTVKIMIQQSYGVRDFQVVGGPSWLGSERYDIVAKPEGSANQEQVKLMTQALLKDRFKLQFHRETKELPTYSLVVAKGGPKFKESEVEKASDGPRGAQVRIGRGQVDLQGAPVAALANQLGQALGRAVNDKTELAGNYDMKLQWTPDESQGSVRPLGGEAPPPSDTSGVSVFTALQDQLGLKLESTKGPVEILVIDRAEKASEN